MRQQQNQQQQQHDRHAFFYSNERAFPLTQLGDILVSHAAFIRPLFRLQMIKSNIKKIPAGADAYVHVCARICVYVAQGRICYVRIILASWLFPYLYRQLA